MTGERVLVIDDSADIRKYIIDAVLKPYAYQYKEASDGQAGLQAILADPPDLVLSDMQMPRLNGMDLIHALKEHGIQIPVILMTSFGSEELAVEMFRLGVKDYLIKPFEEADLFDAMDRALIETRLRQERDDLTHQLADANKDMSRELEAWRQLGDVSRELNNLLDRHAVMQGLLDLLARLTGARQLSISQQIDGELKRVATRIGSSFTIVNDAETDELVFDALEKNRPRVGEPHINPADGETFIVRLVVPVSSNDIRAVVTIVIPADQVTETVISLITVVGAHAAVALDRARLIAESA